ncbi:hypothetical protein FDP41_010849 [Naegleria fowleri]|uniref:Guanylate cyclase domain-containing protein n=1 Tax=Naegleria fowleri TaxID=5763 RepID=A0A6A5CB38_NAEFO|nr:uncharacterized protein FDP41_010849 [Naegleria fowleri]KAF0982870.1 hypothetical protein FDP41_010849 [Naegleria fowleri]
MEQTPGSPPQQQQQHPKLLTQSSITSTSSRKLTDEDEDCHSVKQIEVLSNPLKQRKESQRTLQSDCSSSSQSSLFQPKFSNVTKQTSKASLNNKKPKMKRSTTVTGRGLISSKSFVPITPIGVRPTELESKKPRTHWMPRVSFQWASMFIMLCMVAFSSISIWTITFGVHISLTQKDRNDSLLDNTLSTGRTVQEMLKSLSREAKDLQTSLSTIDIVGPLRSYSQLRSIQAIITQKTLTLGALVDGIYVSFYKSGDLLSITPSSKTESLFWLEMYIQSLSGKENFGKEYSEADLYYWLSNSTFEMTPKSSRIHSNIGTSSLEAMCYEASSTLEPKLTSPFAFEYFSSDNIGAISMKLSLNSTDYGCVGILLSKSYLESLLKPSSTFSTIQGCTVLMNKSPIASYDSQIDTSFIESYSGKVARLNLNTISTADFTALNSYESGIYWNILCKGSSIDWNYFYMALVIIAVPILTFLCVACVWLCYRFAFFKHIKLLSQGFSDIRKLDLESDTVMKALELKSFCSEIIEIRNNFRDIHTNISSFTKYVPVCVSQEVIQNKKTAVLGLEDILCVVSFLDIKDFTSYSEKLTPNQLVRVMSDAFEGLSNLVVDGGAVLDKYIGDCVMSFYECGTGGMQNQMKTACQVAIASVRFLKSMWKIWRQEGLPLLECRIGLNCGPVKRGNFGSNNRFQYTILGDVVNTTSRLEGLNKRYGTEILVSDPIYQTVSQFQMFEIEGRALQVTKSEQRQFGLFKSLNYADITLDEMIFRRVDNVAVKGKDSFIPIYSLVDRCDIPAKQAEVFFEHDLPIYNQGIHLLLDKLDVRGALAKFEEISWKDNLVSQKIQFCKDLLQRSESEWTGLLKLDEK